MTVLTYVNHALKIKSVLFRDLAMKAARRQKFEVDFTTILFDDVIDACSPYMQLAVNLGGNLDCSS